MLDNHQGVRLVFEQLAVLAGKRPLMVTMVRLEAEPGEGERYRLTVVPSAGAVDEHADAAAQRVARARTVPLVPEGTVVDPRGGVRRRGEYVRASHWERERSVGRDRGHDGSGGHGGADGSDGEGGGGEEEGESPRSRTQRSTCRRRRPLRRPHRLPRR